MKLRDDIDIYNTWICSDTHFGHENIVGYCSRPEDHDLLMIEQWRAHVPDDATVLHLGDLCWKGNTYFKNVIASRLTGQRKLLVRGNHDRGRTSFYRDCGFKEIKPFALNLKQDIDTGGFMPVPADEVGAYVIWFDHYPAPGFSPSGFDWRVHGHIHNNGYYDGRMSLTGDALVPFLRNHINVSMEQIRYRPVNLGLMLNAAILGKLPS